MTVEQILPWVLLLSIVAFAGWWIFRPSVRPRKTDFRVITASAVLVLMTGGFIFWQSGFRGNEDQVPSLATVEVRPDDGSAPPVKVEPNGPTTSVPGCSPGQKVCQWGQSVVCCSENDSCATDGIAPHCSRWPDKVCEEGKVECLGLNGTYCCSEGLECVIINQPPRVFSGCWGPDDRHPDPFNCGEEKYLCSFKTNEADENEVAICCDKGQLCGRNENGEAFCENPRLHCEPPLSSCTSRQGDVHFPSSRGCCPPGSTCDGASGKPMCRGQGDCPDNHKKCTRSDGGNEFICCPVNYECAADERNPRSPLYCRLKI